MVTQGDAIVFERQTPNSDGIFVAMLDGRKVPIERQLIAVPNLRSRQLGQNKDNAMPDQKNKHRIQQIEDGGALPRWSRAQVTIRSMNPIESHTPSSAIVHHRKHG